MQRQMQRPAVRKQKTSSYAGKTSVGSMVAQKMLPCQDCGRDDGNHTCSLHAAWSCPSRSVSMVPIPCSSHAAGIFVPTTLCSCFGGDSKYIHQDLPSDDFWLLPVCEADSEAAPVQKAKRARRDPLGGGELREAMIKAALGEAFANVKF